MSRRKQENDISALIIECMNNNYDQVIYQIEVLKSDINKARHDGRTALMYAIYNNNFKLVKYLCENNANKDQQDEYGTSALLLAICTSNIEIAGYLIINGADINIKNKLNETPMHYAATIGNLFIIKMLYDRGANVNVYNNKNHTPLMLSISSKSCACVKFLVNNGAHLNESDFNGDNILHGCVHYDTYDILLFLLNNKNISILDSWNNQLETPLMYSINQNKIEYTKLLLKYGAKTHTNDITGNTPLLYSTQKNDYNLTELLLKHKADPNIYFTWGSYRSPLFNAIQNKDDKLVQLMLDYGANDMMWICIEINDYRNFSNLLHGDNINLKNNNGATLLFFAAEKNKLNFVKILLENGANPNICNHKDRNESPLYQAIINKNYKMVKLLIEYKANINHRLTIPGLTGSVLGESIMGRADRHCWSSEICDYLKSLNAELFYEWD